MRPLLAALIGLSSLGCGVGVSPQPRGSLAPPLDVEPTVVFVQRSGGPGLGPFTAYDRTGTWMADLASELTLGAEYEAIRVTIGPEVFDARPPVLDSRVILLVDERFPGVPFRPSLTQLVVRAALRDAARVRVAGVSGAGKVTFDFELDGKWDYFKLSPTGRYVFADEAGVTGAVIDTVDGAVIWTGGLLSGTFVTDDSAFVYTTRGLARTAVIQPLPGGSPTRAPYPADLGKPALPDDPSWGSKVAMRPVFAVPAGTVFETAGDTDFGQFLWLLDPAGRWRPLEKKLQRGAIERVLGLAERGNVVVFRRDAAPGQTTQAALGAFGHDLNDGTPRTYGPALSFGAERFYEVTADRLERRELGEAGSTLIATVTPLKDGWKRKIGPIAADGRVIVVAASTQFPFSYPADGTLVFDDRGQRLGTFDVGNGLLDPAGTLYAQRSANPQREEKVVILDLPQKGFAVVNDKAPFGLVYRPR
jgi:hypothetical protein